MTVKYLKRVRCINADGARSRSNPQEALVLDQEYLVLADVLSAETPERSDSSGYFLYNPLTSRALPRLYRRDRFIDVVELAADPLSAPVPVAPPVPARTAALADANSEFSSFDVGDEVTFNGQTDSELGLTRGQDYIVHMVVQRAHVAGATVAGIVVINEDSSRVVPGVVNSALFTLA